MSQQIDMDLLKDVLSNKTAQNALIRLYADSQAECQKNGTIGMEVGMSREKDILAFLKFYLDDGINCETDNRLTEDCMLGPQKLSIKHKTGNIGAPIKAKWTAASIPAKDAIKTIIEAPDEYYPALLIVYFDTKKKTIVFICISAEHNKNTIKGLGNAAFKISNGNTRGIDYSREAMKELMKNICFRVDIANADLTTGMNPLHRRMDILRSMMPESA